MPAHLVEFDLCAAVSDCPRANRSPAADSSYSSAAGVGIAVEAYGWTLRDRLPVIPVPLADGDPDVPLDLQAAFTTTYDRAGYDYALDYHSDSQAAP